MPFIAILNTIQIRVDSTQKDFQMKINHRSMQLHIYHSELVREIVLVSIFRRPCNHFTKKKRTLFLLLGSRYALMVGKLILFHILAKFDIIVTSKTQIPLKLGNDSFNLKPSEGIHVGLKLRNSI